VVIVDDLLAERCEGAQAGVVLCADDDLGTTIGCAAANGLGVANIDAVQFGPFLLCDIIDFIDEDPLYLLCQ
jgi:hypothetical protein